MKRGVARNSEILKFLQNQQTLNQKESECWFEGNVLLGYFFFSNDIYEPYSSCNKNIQYIDSGADDDKSMACVCVIFKHLADKLKVKVWFDKYLAEDETDNDGE